MIGKADNSVPKRIQRKRSKGWRMPANTVYVGRGTPWGNPWYVENGLVKIRAENGAVGIEGGGDIHTVIAVYESCLIRRLRSGSIDLTALRGKNLACWCALDQPCHADVLLKVANTEILEMAHTDAT